MEFRFLELLVSELCVLFLSGDLGMGNFGGTKRYGIHFFSVCLFVGPSGEV